MKLEQIAAQFYTIREHLETPSDFRESCRKIAKIGYRAVQISGVDRDVISEKEIAAFCREHGLVICATHENGKELLENPGRSIERLQTLSCKLTAYPFPAGIDFTSEYSVAGLIGGLNASGKLFADASLTLAYHNHHHEFQRLDGRLILERIYEDTDPRHLHGEPDTYWLQFGGGDHPVAWCRKLKGRLPMIQLKDYGVNSDNQIAFCEVGRGNLNFPAIIEAAEESGCQWFIVEQDTCPDDPFESLAMSFKYLRKLAC